MGRLLQRLSDRIEKGADRADRTANFVADTKERGAEYAKDKIRSIGRAAVATTELTVGATLLTASATARGVKKLGEVSGDAFMTGMNKVETAMDKTGEAINNRVDTAKNSYQTYQFNRETKTNDRKFRKEYAKEVKAFDKDARREQKSQAKQDKIDLKQAAREDAKFERSMRKKAAQERKAARRAKWIERLNTVKSASAEKIESAKDTLNSGIDSSREFAERSKRRVQVTRAAGRMALNTYRDTKEAFKAN